MFAIVKTGGKQIKAAKDDVIIVEKLEGEPGTKVAGRFAGQQSCRPAWRWSFRPAAARASRAA